MSYKCPHAFLGSDGSTLCRIDRAEIDEGFFQRSCYFLRVHLKACPRKREGGRPDSESIIESARLECPEVSGQTSVATSGESPADQVATQRRDSNHDLAEKEQLSESKELKK